MNYINRGLIVDGADPTKLIGTDITGAFFELGYQLYGDKEGTPITFVALSIEIFFAGSTGVGKFGGPVNFPSL